MIMSEISEMYDMLLGQIDDFKMLLKSEIRNPDIHENWTGEGQMKLTEILSALNKANDILCDVETEP